MTEGRPVLSIRYSNATNLGIKKIVPIFTFTQVVSMKLIDKVIDSEMNSFESVNAVDLLRRFIINEVRKI